MIIKGNTAAFRAVFESKSQISLVIHTNPDGDALGSALALQMILEKLGNETRVLIPNMYPSFLKWMPNIDKAFIFEHQHKEVRSFLMASTYVFCLDFNGPKRSGTMQEDILKATSERILIDHHIEPELDAFQLAYHCTDVSSTAELVFQLTEELGYQELMDEFVASSLYTGIMTDTGSFSFALKNPDTFNIVAKLIQYGIDAERLHRLVYDTYTEDRLRLLGHAISNRMLVLDTFQTAIISLNINDLKLFNYKIGDTEGLVNYPLSMEKINFAILITERKDQVRLSFRSKGSFSVNDFARRHFSGGGHHNAAGATSHLSLQETTDKLLAALPLHLKELNYQY